jgi:homoserine O-acetyltransferase/O-succinyltransferase
MQHVEFIDSFTFESGEVLHQVPVTFSTWGKLNKDADNAIIVCHSLTANTDVNEWWPDLLTTGGAFDPADHFVICLNVIGSPYGTVSPLTIKPSNGKPYGNNFPLPTIRDNIKLHKVVLDKLEINQVYCVIGASLGGMQALEWAIQYPDLVKKIIPIAVGASHSAWCIGLSEVQCQCIENDPNWNDGNYEPEEPPKKGLGLARMMAMISYRSPQAFHKKFNRQINDKTKDFDVKSYLKHQEESFIKRFDANCYITLIKSMDTHDITLPGMTIVETIKGIRQDALVIGIASDILYPVNEQYFLSDNLPNSKMVLFDYPHGHDAFLIEVEKLNEAIKDWL